MKKTSLLASEESDEPPSLHSGPAALEEFDNNKEETALMPLVNQSSTTSDSQLPQHLLLEDEQQQKQESLVEPLLSSSVMEPEVVHRTAAMNSDEEYNNNNNYANASYVYITVVAGTLTLLCLSFLWGSFLSSPWFETHVAISVSWLKENIITSNSDNNNNNSSFTSSSFLDTKILSSDLGAIIGIFLKSKQYTTFTFLIISSIVLPCATTLILPLLIFARTSSSAVTKSLSLLPSSLFKLYENTIRLSFFVIYVLIFLSLTTAFVQIEWTDTSIDILNQFNGGLVSYILGISCALCAVTLMRYEQCSRISSTATTTDWGYNQPPLIPPASSFRYAFKNQSGLSCYLSLEDVRVAAGNNDNSVSSPERSSLHHNHNSTSSRKDNTLRHSSTITEISSSQHSDTNTTQIISNIMDSSGNNILPSQEDINIIDNNKKKSCCCNLNCLYHVVCWELCTLSVILFVTMFTLPLGYVTYNGIATSFMQSASMKLFLGSTLSLLWNVGKESQTKTWVLVLFVLSTVLYVIIIPVVSLILCVSIWISSSSSPSSLSSLPSDKTSSRIQRMTRWLYCLRPSINSITFAIALIMTIRSLHPIAEILFDQQFRFDESNDNDSHSLFNSKVMEIIKRLCVLGETCLDISGTVKLGAVAFVMQSISLELFVILTLRSFPVFKYNVAN